VLGLKARVAAPAAANIHGLGHLAHPHAGSRSLDAAQLPATPAALNQHENQRDRQNTPTRAFHNMISRSFQVGILVSRPPTRLAVRGGR
jgi:hypothetical protein